MMTVLIEQKLRKSSNHGIIVTVSMGSSTYPETAKLASDLIRLADESMYQSKLAKQHHLP